MLDSLIKNTEEIILSIINILPKKIINEIQFYPTIKKYDSDINIFILFEVSKLINNYDNIADLAKEYKISFIENLNKNLTELKKYFYEKSQNYIEDISLYLQNSSQLSQDIVILKYIPYDFRIIKGISNIHEYTIMKKEVNYDSVIGLKIPTKIGIKEKYIKLFNDVYKKRVGKPFIKTITTNDFINVTNNLINEYFDKVELTPKEIDTSIRPSDLKTTQIENNQDLEIYLYNYYQNLKYNISKKEVDISVWEFLKKF